MLRVAIEEQWGGSSLDVVLAFNAALLLAEKWRESPASMPLAELGETVAQFHADHRPGFGGTIGASVRTYPIGEFARILLEEDQDESPYLLDADLLIRHASGRLYQEAHRRLAKTPSPVIRQPTLFVDPLPVSTGGKRGPAPRYVHHTPPWLARAMVEVAIAHRGGRGAATLDVLDPACGSGVFLIETARELERFNGGVVELRGMDLSDEAGTMTEFCVGEASRGLTNVTVSQSSRRGIDSLATGTDWGTPDIVLMNPPFKAWKDLDPETRATVKKSLGLKKAGRPDLYLAFLARAAAALKPGGVLASVVPSAFLHASSASKVRARLGGGEFRVRLVAHFRGFETFDKATVETAVLVVSKSAEVAPVRTIRAESGHAERAVRLLRTLGPAEVRADSEVEIGVAPVGTLRGDAWILARAKDHRFAARLAENTSTRVDDFFTVRSGMRGVGARGSTKVLVLPNSEFIRLVPTAAEKRFFRPIGDIIQSGRIVPSAYVFYPYGSDGRLLLTTEEAVAAAVPGFYRATLLPAKEALQSRKSANRKKDGGASRNWWEPSEPVTTWLAHRTPRIVSQEFGKNGNFAFDQKGHHAVVGGTGWCWNGDDPKEHVFYRYLAMLNSKAFGRLLRFYSLKLKSEAYRLEGRFVHSIPLPDLRRGPRVLTVLGQRIHAGETFDADALEEAVLDAYGVTAGRRPRNSKLSEYAKAESNQTIKLTFAKYASLWKKETSYLSSMAMRTDHPAYQRILGLGIGVVPLMLADMKVRQTPWFHALRHLTGVNRAAALRTRDGIGC